VPSDALEDAAAVMGTRAFDVDGAAAVYCIELFPL
jgi:hypothetical protein